MARTLCPIDRLGLVVSWLLRRQRLFRISLQLAPLLRLADTRRSPDAECLAHGIRTTASYPLPPLTVGISPAILSRAMLQTHGIPFDIFNAGLSITPKSTVFPSIDLGVQPAHCVSTGRSLPLVQVKKLWQQGLEWGHILAAKYPQRFMRIGGMCRGRNHYCPFSFDSPWL